MPGNVSPDGAGQLVKMRQAGLPFKVQLGGLLMTVLIYGVAAAALGWTGCGLVRLERWAGDVYALRFFRPPERPYAGL
jgi:hypothetical protein